MSLPGSVETWRDGAPEPAVPASLRVAPDASVGERLRGWRERHAVRAERAERYFEASRHPERGLPVAGNRAVLAFVRNLVGESRTLAALVLAFNVAAAVVGLLVPKMLGGLIDHLTGPNPSLSTLDSVALSVVVVVVVQSLFTFGARLVSAVFGQAMLATAREGIVRTVLGLPLGRIESASTGDLVTRVTRDVSTMSHSVQMSLPQAVITGVTALLTLGAVLLNSPLLGLPALLGVALAYVSVRGYLRRAPQGYITEGGTYSVINTTFTETAEGARTVEALGLQGRRIEQGDDDIEVSAQAERYTMSLRNLMFGWLDLAYSLPTVLIVLLGAWAYPHGWVTIGQITAATLYAQALVEPLDIFINHLDRLQVGLASTTRLLGIAEVPPDRVEGPERPADSHLVGRDLHFAYREGRDVLHGVDLDLRPGERLAIVGPSGSGKSTLGRLLSGINAPRLGRASVGGVDLTRLPLALLRTEVALVTQEHHVFVGSVRDNVVLAREDADDERLWRALELVDAREWVERLPQGLATRVGSGQYKLTPGQAQQLALARLVVADPHTLVLDEATSLIDPTTARHLEGSMAALLHNRTVVAIAHRLHTAHDADRIAVVIDGRIAELGSHDELMALDGEYAALWRAWTS